MISDFLERWAGALILLPFATFGIVMKVRAHLRARELERQQMQSAARLFAALHVARDAHTPGTCPGDGFLVQKAPSGETTIEYDRRPQS